jgi:hypothetical protein
MREKEGIELQILKCYIFKVFGNARLPPNHYPLYLDMDVKD